MLYKSSTLASLSSNPLVPAQAAARSSPSAQTAAHTAVIPVSRRILSSFSCIHSASAGLLPLRLPLVSSNTFFLSDIFASPHTMLLFPVFYISPYCASLSCILHFPLLFFSFLYSAFPLIILLFSVFCISPYYSSLSCLLHIPLLCFSPFSCFIIHHPFPVFYRHLHKNGNKNARKFLLKPVPCRNQL